MSSVECNNYPWQIPDYAEQALARLHAGRYSSLAHFEIYGRVHEASTYIASRHGVATTLLLHRRDGPVVRVLNEGIPLAEEEVRRFAAHMMQGAKPPGVVLFRAIAMEAASGGGLLQRVECEQDSVLTLPASVDGYHDLLGNNTRQLLRNRMSKLKREHPSFHFQISEGEQIDPQHVQAIFALHRARMAVKRGGTMLDTAEEQRVLRMVTRCGMVGVISVDGICRAGSICYRNGDVVSARFLAHDPDYDLYRIGFLCAYLMCTACVGRDGIRQFNFGWGEEQYKTRLGGRPRILCDVAVYRNWTQRLRLAPLGLRLAWKGLAFRLRNQLRAMTRRWSKR